jgi:pimeloyl-ACP methyl ester carboxylesterase
VFSRALLTLGERLGPLHAVIGHSMGGAATVIAWSRGLEVERLAVLGAPSRLSRVVLGFPSALGLNERAASRFVRYVERQAGGAVDSLDPLRLAIEVSGAAETPLLIVHDPADAEVPLSDASELAAAWPGAEFVTLDAGGHRKMLRHPGVIDAVLSHVGSAMTARRGTR